jgi:hypothetical protein
LKSSLDFIEWQKCLYGIGQPARPAGVAGVLEAMDDGYIVTGTSAPYECDVAITKKNEFGVLKLNFNGDLIWKKCLGGNHEDAAYGIHHTVDGGYVVVGSTRFEPGDNRGCHGPLENSNGWVVKLDRQGNMLWQRCLGGSLDDSFNSIEQTSDGGYIVAGYALSKDGDVNGLHEDPSSFFPKSDCWVVKLDLQGNILWQKCLGGSGSEHANSIQETKDGNYILAGGTNSKDGDVKGLHEGYSGNIPYSDYWVVKLSSANGAIQWQKCLGGKDWDEAFSVQQTNDEGYIIVGYSASDDGDLNGNMCQNGNYWMVKLRSDNYICFSGLSKPNLAYLGKEDYTVRGNKFTRYLLDVTNKNDYPASLFKAAPDLPPCGKNQNSARTWVNIYDEKDAYIYGFCALSSPASLGKIWFAVPKGSTPPEKVYVTLIDRRCDNPITLSSNMISIK